MSLETTQADPTPPKPNQHIREYLNYYLKLAHAPNYAVFLNGPWGIGKTYLVKQILADHFGEKKNDYAYISLYGLTSTDQIDEALLVAAYPVLGNKSIKVAGRLGRSVAKRVGLDPELKAADFLRKDTNRLYVFDDLERCEMPVNQVLGYINEFVEHDGCKVLIVGNEAEIDGSLDYRKRREKLIGKTLLVQSTFEEAFHHFVSFVDDPETKEFTKAKAVDIAAVFRQSGLDNLRILQQTLWDFERLYRATAKTYKSNDAAMTCILRLFFALSFEIKAGRLDQSDLASRMEGLVAAMARLEKKDVELTALQVAESRYPEIELGNPILSDQLLINVLVQGIVDESDISRSLAHSPFFVRPEDEPAWRTIWFGLERTEEQFSRAVSELEKQFLERVFSITGLILHVMGIRLWLSDLGVLKKTRPEVVQEGRKYIDDLRASGRLEPVPVSRSDDFRHSAYDGLGIQEASTADYKELFNYLKVARHRATEDRFPSQSVELLKEMEIDPYLFLRRLCVTNSEDNIYCRVPILAAIDPEVFVDRMLAQSPSHQRTIMSAFTQRYDHGQLERDLPTEKPWLASIREKLLARTASMSAIGRFRTQKLIEWHVSPFLDSEVTE